MFFIFENLYIEYNNKLQNVLFHLVFKYDMIGYRILKEQMPTIIFTSLEIAPPLSVTINIFFYKNKVLLLNPK